MDAPEKRRWYCPTPGWLVYGSLAVTGLLFLSDRFALPVWHKGYAVLVTVASVGAVFVLLLLWFLVALLFRLRFQFGIRTLLVLVVAVALPFSWLAGQMKSARDQGSSVEAIRNLGGVIKCDYEAADPATWPAKPDGPAWLRTLLEDDFFNDVYNATLFSNAEMEQLKGLPQLKRLWLGGYDGYFVKRPQVTDAGLAHVAGLRKLKVLIMSGIKLTDSGLTHIAGLKELESLTLANTHVTDEGLAHLTGLSRLLVLELHKMPVRDAGLAHVARLSQLQELSLRETQVTDAGLARLAVLDRLRGSWRSTVRKSQTPAWHTSRG